MNADARERASDDTRARTLAIACIAVWVVAAATARLFGIWLAVGGAAIGLGAAVWILDGAQARKLLRPSPRLIVIGVATGAAMTAVTLLLYPLLARHAPFIAPETTLLYAAFRAPSLTVAAIALAPVVIGEELVWRGVVQAALVQRLGRAAGVMFAAVAYALAHAAIGSAVLVAVALLCGVAWGALRAASKSLVPPLVAHLVWDALVLFWLPIS